MANPNWRVAIYAEDDFERARLKDYVARRGWTCWGREYTRREWKELISDGTKQRFHAICASFDGLVWFAPVTRQVDFERVLPKRGTPPGPPKGSVIGGRRAAEELAIGLITERGPQTLDDVTRAVIAAGLGTGSAGRFGTSCGLRCMDLTGSRLVTTKTAISDGGCDP